MPLYEFQCGDCQTVFEELVSMGSTGEGLSCPKCGGTKIAKQVSTFFGQTKSAGSACQFADMCPGQQAMPGGCCGGACHGH